jgi:hypothetical protein
MAKGYLLPFLMFLITQHLFAQSCVTTSSRTNITTCPSDLPFIWNGQVYNSEGSYNVILTNAAGCDSLATLNLTVNPITTSTTAVSICSSALPYSWNGNTYNASGSYNITLVNAEGCDSIVTLYLTVYALPTLTILQNDTTMCKGDTITLEVAETGFATYIWSPSIGLSGPLILDPKAAPSLSTIYTLKGVTANGCSAVDSVTITVVNCSKTVTLCPNTATESLTSNVSGTSYQWQVDAGNGYTNITNNSDYDSTNTASLNLFNIPSSWYGYQYRCIVDGNTSSAYVLQFADTWTGTKDSTWENPANWSCNSLPDINTDVIINSGTVVLGSNTAIRSLTISPNASFTVATGNNLVVTH